MHAEFSAESAPLKPNLSPLHALTHSLAAFSEQLNTSLAPLPTLERVARIVELFPDNAIVTTSGGIQSRVLPTIFSHLKDALEDRPLLPVVHRFPFVFIDTGDHFPETLRYVQSTEKDLGLRLLRVAHDLTPGEFKIEHAKLVEAGQDSHSAFDHLTKVRVLRGLIDHPEIIGLSGITAVISGNRRDQSRDRADLPFVQAKNGLLYFYPLADWTGADIEHYMQMNAIPHQPLHARGYRSVGNQSDTRAAQAHDTHEKDGRHLGLKTECGLHMWWQTEERHGFGARLVKDWTETVRSPVTAD